MERHTNTTTVKLLFIRKVNSHALTGKNAETVLFNWVITAFFDCLFSGPWFLKIEKH